jgi:hypothetical protein
VSALKLKQSCVAVLILILFIACSPCHAQTTTTNTTTVVQSVDSEGRRTVVLTTKITTTYANGTASVAEMSTTTLAPSSPTPTPTPTPEPTPSLQQNAACAVFYSGDNGSCTDSLVTSKKCECVDVLHCDCVTQGLTTVGYVLFVAVPLFIFAVIVIACVLYRRSSSSSASASAMDSHDRHGCAGMLKSNLTHMCCGGHSEEELEKSSRNVADKYHGVSVGKEHASFMNGNMSKRDYSFDDGAHNTSASIDAHMTSHRTAIERLGSDRSEDFIAMGTPRQRSVGFNLARFCPLHHYTTAFATANSLFILLLFTLPNLL